jgi:hypothetical protein
MADTRGHGEGVEGARNGALRGAAAGLSLLLATGPADAAPLRIASDAPPLFTATVPDGYRAMPPAEGSEVMAAFAREGDPARAVVLLLVRMEGPVPQGPLAPATRAALVRADAFPFRDRVERFRVLGFDVEGLRGEAEVNGHRVVRFAVPVPVRERGLVLTAMGPLEDEPEARRVATAVLGSMRAPTDWLTPAGRALAWAAGVGTTVGALLSALYALLALVLFRRVDRWHRARGAALVVAGAGWLALAAWTLARPSTSARVTGGLILAFGVVLAARGAGMIRHGAAPAKS